MNLIKKICPRRINKFEYHPSIGASGGLLVAWNSSLFQGVKIFENKFAISIQFTSCLNGNSWILSNIYVPCQPNERTEFINSLQNIQIFDDIDWFVGGGGSILLDILTTETERVEMFKT